MQPLVFQSQYEGSVQDIARHMLPGGACWKITDYLPNLGAPLRKRGGWQDTSPNLGTNIRTEAVAFAPFATGNQLIVITDDGHLWNVSTTGFSGTDKGAAAIPVQRPVFFTNRVIIPGATPKVYDGSAAPTNLGGTPPGGVYAESYKSYLVLAGSAANPERLWFSDVLDPTIWDTANSYIGATNPVVGLASLRNAILIFSKSMTERIRGSVPPPGGDMVLEPVFSEGCIDARSIVTIGDKVIWANGNGVWISDGAALDNLIALGGLSQYWATMLAGFDSSTWKVAAGYIHGDYIVSITNGDTFIDCLRCNVETRKWTFISNLRATMFAEAYGTTPELYFAMRARPNVGQLSDIYKPKASLRTDADGTPVQPVIETAFFRGFFYRRKLRNVPISNRYKDILIGNALISVATSPTIEVSYITSPFDTTYTPFTLDDGVTHQAIQKSTDYQRSKIRSRLANDGFALKIAQVGASDDTFIYDIEATQHERSGLR